MCIIMNSFIKSESTFNEILSFDKITVTVLPEKKGFVIKHFEYEVHSERNKCVVNRRFSDFVTLNQLLLSRFPFRLIPALPPKKLVGNGDHTFLEDRRKKLERYLNLLSRHPVIGLDQLLRFFLTETNDDFQSKIKLNFTPAVEEFYLNNNNQSNEALKNLKAMDMSKYPTVKEQLKLLQQSLTRLIKTVTKLIECNQSVVIHTLDFGKEANSLITQEDSLISRCFQTNNQNANEDLFLKYIAIAEELKTEISLEEENVLELLNGYMELLDAYKDLCNRYENDLRRHSKETSTKIKNVDITVEALEELERKSHFALHCLLSEAMLIKRYSAIVPLIINHMSSIKSNSCARLAQLFAAIKL